MSALRLLRHPAIAVGALVLVLLMAGAILAPWLWTVDPQAISPLSRLKPPSSAAWFGSDMVGRDLYSRTLYGARISLVVGVSVACLATAVGLAIGLLAGFNRLFDGLAMRVMDAMMAIPAILLAVAMIALTGASLQNVIIAITVSEVPRVARLVRGIVLQLKASPFVEAAQVVGTRFPALLVRHILHVCLGDSGRSSPEFHWRRITAFRTELGKHHRRGPDCISDRASHRAVPGACAGHHRPGGEFAR